MTAVVWTIAGSDSGAGAGLQADTRVFQALGVHGATVVTAITAQNPERVVAAEPVSTAMVAAQMDALDALPPLAVKTGMLGSAETVRAVAKHLRGRDTALIVDPVMVASSGARLADDETMKAVVEELLPFAALLTPNIHECEVLTGKSARDPAAVEKAATQLLEHGCREVLVKGGHGAPNVAADFWTDGKERAWIVSPRRQGLRTHGTGCTLAAAIVGARALGFSGLDSIVLAKSYLNRGLRRAYDIAGTSPVIEGLPWPQGAEPGDLPWLVSRPEDIDRPLTFLHPGMEPLGFYPIVDSLAWLERLLPLGVRSVQLRIKDADGEALRRTIASAVSLANRYRCRLFVNDYWEHAISHGAYGVHLGQEDVARADLPRIAAAGLRLGISTHSYSEVARAHALKPSYVAIGPIFPTTAKPMLYPPQGIEGLSLWRQLLSYPLVAIGGISLQRGKELRRAGADGIAVISDVTGAVDVRERVRDWLGLW